MIPGLVFVFTLHVGSSVRADSDDRWRSNDKARHFLTSAFLDCLSYSALRTARVSRTGALVRAAALTAGVGIGKEVYDLKFGGDPSLKDLTADGAGIAAATVLLRKTAR